MADNIVPRTNFVEGIGRFTPDQQIWSHILAQYTLPESISKYDGSHLTTVEDIRLAADHIVLTDNPHSVTADQVNCLSKINTISYVPTTDYHPATKKYVDDNGFYYTTERHVTTTTEEWFEMAEVPNSGNYSVIVRGTWSTDSDQEEIAYIEFYKSNRIPILCVPEKFS